MACAGDEDVEGGYNSEDEYSHIGVQLTEEEWQEKDRRFDRLIKKKKGKLDKPLIIAVVYKILGVSGGLTPLLKFTQ